MNFIIFIIIIIIIIIIILFYYIHSTVLTLYNMQTNPEKRCHCATPSNSD